MTTPPPVTLARLVVLFFACLAASAMAEVKIETVHYEHDNVALEGVLAYDEAVSGPRPGVLIVHQWWGRGPQETKRARQLAEQGYTAFAIDMFGKGKRTDDPAQAQAWSSALYGDRVMARDRLSKALSTLRDHGTVDPSRIAIIGYCFGGTMAFELAYAGAGIEAAVSFHGGPMSPMPRDNAKSKLLILHGTADPLTPLSDMVALADELTVGGADVQLHAFGGAQHSFTDPTADQHGIEGVRYDATAARRAWAQMLLLFEELWGPPPAGMQLAVTPAIDADDTPEVEVPGAEPSPPAAATLPALPATSPVPDAPASPATAPATQPAAPATQPAAPATQPAAPATQPATP
jgi:dienelactone hydrolase